MSSYPDSQKIGIIGFFFENRLYWKFGFWPLLFTGRNRASKHLDHACLQILEATTLYYTWVDPKVSRLTLYKS